MYCGWWNKVEDQSSVNLIGIEGAECVTGSWHRKLLWLVLAREQTVSGTEPESQLKSEKSVISFIALSRNGGLLNHIWCSHWAVEKWM